MGKLNKTRKFAAVKRMISPKDARLQSGATARAEAANAPKPKLKEALVRNIPQVSSAMFFAHNSALGPPFHVLVDTNFINFSIQNKLDMHKAMMDCLCAKVTVCITDSVMAELEKLGPKYRVALRIAKDPRFERLPAMRDGNTYADDDLVERVTAHRCYLVATCDKDLKRRLRKIPGVPIMTIKSRKYEVERLPGEWRAGRARAGPTLPHRACGRANHPSLRPHPYPAPADSNSFL
jgi:U3 small nucleolar RNA-associated protein 24